VIGESDLYQAAKRQTQSALGKLVALEKGRFGIDLNLADLPPEVEEIKLGEGLDVSEALLEAAKLRDESYRGGLMPADTGFEASFIPRSGSASAWPDFPLDGEEEPQRGNTAPLDFGQTPAGKQTVERDADDRTAHLCSLLTELRHYSFEAEVSLLIMRYASEVATRGILFVVKDDELWGLGQFGITSHVPGKTADDLVRGIRVALDFDGVFGQVAMTGEAFVGPRSVRDTEFLDQVGGAGPGLTMFALPLVCNGSTIFIIYGDNSPGESEMRGMNELVALVNQSSIVLEKIVLERRVHEIESLAYAVQ
jgi:hypothetical protein